MLGVVQGFEGAPIYGWEFFDQHDEELAKWGDRLSLDWRSGPDGSTHSLCLFQEGGDHHGDRHLDLLIWFDTLVVRAPSGEVIPLDEVATGGERWRDALYRGDPRT